MALLSYLLFGDKPSSKYLLTDFKYHVRRHHNGIRPDADAMCERIELSIIVPAEDFSFFQWYIDGSSRDGKVLNELDYYESSSEYKCRNVSFTGAVCFAIAGKYSADENKLMELTLSFMSQEVKIDIDNVKRSYLDSISTNKATSKKVILVANPGEYKFPIQYFHYSFYRERNNMGFPIGPTKPAVLDFMINCDEEKSEVFVTNNDFENLLFYFDDFSYKVNGYVVDAEIKFDNTLLVEKKKNEITENIIKKINGIIEEINQRSESNLKKLDVMDDHSNILKANMPMLMYVKVLIADISFGEKAKLTITE